MVSVKDLVTSGLFPHGSRKGADAGRSSGHLAAPQLKFTWGHAAENGSTEDMGKMALVPQKEEKGQLSLGPMVMSGWELKDYSTLVEESVSLVGKSTGMPETTSRGFALEVGESGVG